MSHTTVTGRLAGIKNHQHFAVIVRTTEGDVEIVIPPLALDLLPDPAAHFERLVGEKMGFHVLPDVDIEGARVLDMQYRKNSEGQLQ